MSPPGALPHRRNYRSNRNQAQALPPSKSHQSFVEVSAWGRGLGLSLTCFGMSRETAPCPGGKRAKIFFHERHWHWNNSSWKLARCPQKVGEVIYFSSLTTGAKALADASMHSRQLIWVRSLLIISHFWVSFSGTTGPSWVAINTVYTLHKELSGM